MSQTEVQLAERKLLLEERIRQACIRAGRNPAEVRMIAVTKYSSLEETKQIFELGVRDLGESRWQEARHKWEQIGGSPEWHFIGHLQTNKVKDVLGKFAWIHSLDRQSLAEELQRKAELLDLQVNCLVQVNVSGEHSKYGLAPADAVPFLTALRDFPRIHVCGLMTMAPHDAAEDVTRAVFRGLRELRDRMNAQNAYGCSLEHLSMGMSDDFEIAIEEGATMIRLGSALMEK